MLLTLKKGKPEMKFNVIYSETSVEKLWLDSASASKPAVTNKSMQSYEGLDYEQFKAALRELVDPPDKELTDEDIKNDFGPEASSEFASKLKSYYNFRKKLHDELVRCVDSVVADPACVRESDKVLLDNCVCLAYYEREIPEELCRLASRDDMCKPEKTSAKVIVQIVE